MQDYCVICGADVSDLGTQVCDKCRKEIEDKDTMTNYEKIKNMSVEEMAQFLCDQQTSADECMGCPANGICGNGKSGYERYLEGEVKTND